MPTRERNALAATLADTMQVAKRNPISYAHNYNTIASREMSKVPALPIYPTSTIIKRANYPSG